MHILTSSKEDVSPFDTEKNTYYYVRDDIPGEISDINAYLDTLGLKLSDFTEAPEPVVSVSKAAYTPVHYYDTYPESKPMTVFESDINLRRLITATAASAACIGLLIFIAIKNIVKAAKK